MDKPRLSRILNPRDRAALDAEIGTSWVPKDPREVLLPYTDQPDEKEDLTSVKAMQAKAKAVHDEYGEIIQRCLEVEDEIKQQSKHVKIPLDESTNRAVVEAVRRVFGTDGSVITFDMYMRCVHALAEITNKNIPTPQEQN